MSLKSKVPQYTPDHYVTYAGEGPHWCVEPDGEATIRLSKVGVASQQPQTVFEVFQKAVEKHGEKEALKFEQSPGNWKTWTYKEYYEECIRAARAFVELGVQPFDAVNIIGFNSPEWFFANLGAIACGAKAAGIYTTNEPEACHYICEHSGARVVVCEDNNQLKKFLQIRDRLPKLKAIIMWKGEVPADANAEGSCPVLSWEDFIKLAEKVPEDEILKKRIPDQRPGHCCTLIYTSGTTGTPKAVMMSHDNLTWVVKALYEPMRDLGFLSGQEHTISYLPLSHIAAQVVDIHMPIGGTAFKETKGWATVYFARPDALKGTLGDTLKFVRPTFFFGVPRVWEKMMEKMKAIGQSAPPLRKKIAAFAKSIGKDAYYTQMVGGSNYMPWGHMIANTLVFSKVQAALGLDRCKMCMTGAAPISKETLEFFGSLGLKVLELYGMSECAGPQTVSFPHVFKIKSTGPPLPGCEMKIDHVADRDKEGQGEICFRGRHIMMGYMNNKEKTQESIDPEGWLHSGDIGQLDENGLLFITGRIKELIITAGGENIAPVPVEDSLKAALPGISNAVLIGDKKKYVVVLVTLHCEPNEDGTFSNKLTGPSLAVSPNAKTVEEAQKDETWTKYLNQGREAANEHVVSRAAKMQKIAIVPEFSVPGGDLTPTLKLKRPIVLKKNEGAIAALYGE